jgi:hypothetical protein
MDGLRHGLLVIPHVHQFVEMDWSEESKNAMTETLLTMMGAQLLVHFSLVLLVVYVMAGYILGFPNITDVPLYVETVMQEVTNSVMMEI